MSVAPSGWYPDPQNPSSVRYWDGAEWTVHTAAAAAPAATALPGPTTPDGVPLAGYGQRVLAYLIDTLIVGVGGVLVGLPQQIETQRRINDLSLTYLQDSEPDFAGFWHGYVEILRDQLVWQLPVMLLGLAYFVVLLRWRGATVGKMVLGLQVRLRERPGQLPWGAIAARVFVLNVVGVIPILLVTAGWWIVAALAMVVTSVFVVLNLLWPAWDSKRQALHDKLARTNVVKAR